MNSIAPLEVWRSEAFAEDLLDDEQASVAAGPVRRKLNGVVLCLLPLAVALVGGVMAFFHTVG